MGIYDELNNLDFIKEYEIMGKMVFFCANKEVAYDNMVKCGSEYEYFQVPFIPRNKAGLIDKTKLEEIGLVSNETYSEIRDILLQAGIQNEIKIIYNNIEKGIEFNTVKKNEELPDKADKYVSDKPALATNGLLNGNNEFKNLTELLMKRADSSKKIIYLEKYGQEEQTYKDLYREASYLANGLREIGLKQGDKLIFQLPYNKGFVECFWACMLLGIIPAPMGVLDDYSVKNVNSDKLCSIWRHLDKPYVVTASELKYDISKIEDIISEKLNIITLEELKIAKPFGNPYDWDSEETCLILFTSGSTGTPKGVTLSQRNIFGRTLGEIQTYGLDKNEVDLNWMTLTHAAGLIWSHIRDMFLDILQVQVNSELILNKPLLWLELMDKYKASITWAPNFAYALVNNYLEDDKNYGWNLSRLNYIFSGGEANVSKNLRWFMKRLEKYSLPENALKPAFGMTETSSCITYYNDFSFDNSSDEDKFLPVGTPMAGAEIRIVDDMGNLLKEGEVGHVQGKGESFTKGYYNNDQANLDSFTSDGYLITGDMGYIKDNNLVLTGREKDIIIINGLNYFVQDIEAVVDDMPEVNASFTVATSIKNKAETNEVILVFFSPKDECLLTEDINIEELKELVLKVKNRIREKCLLNPEYVIPVSSKYSERTEIGKKQRNIYKSAFREGGFNDILNKIEDRNQEKILVKKWTRKEIGGKQACRIYLWNADENICKLLEEQKISYDLYNKLNDMQENEILLDFFFYEDLALDITPENLKIVLKKASEHIKEIIKAKKRMTVIFPTKQSINTENDMDFRINNSFIVGLLKTANLENPLLNCRVVDFDEIDFSLLSNEMNLSVKDDITIYRNRERYIPGIYTINSSYSNEALIPREGLVLVAGGLGGIGVHVSKYLINTYDSKLLIIGSSTIEKNIENYNELNSISKNIIYVKADITNYEEVLCAVGKAEEVWKTQVSTIVNLSGKISSHQKNEAFFYDLHAHTLENEELNNIFETSAVKLLGTYNLEKIRKSRENASMIVFCSLTANFGGISMGAYSLSNTFQENYCGYLKNCGEKVYCISWSMWSNTGLNKYGNSSSAVFGGFNELDIQQGIGYLDCIIKNNIQSSYVGINRDSSRMRYAIFDLYKMQLAIRVKDELDRKKVKDIIRQNNPQLASMLVCPIDKVRFTSSEGSSEHQNKLLAIWKDTLNMEEISITDNIFDLGGNSLTIFKIVSNINDELKIDLKPIDIMTYPNICELSAYLSGRSKKGSYSEPRTKNTENIHRKRDIRKNRRG